MKHVEKKMSEKTSADVLTNGEIVTSVTVPEENRLGQKKSAKQNTAWKKKRRECPKTSGKHIGSQDPEIERLRM